MMPADEVRARVAALGLSHQDLAKFLGISDRHLRKWLRIGAGPGSLAHRLAELEAITRIEVDRLVDAVSTNRVMPVYSSLPALVEAVPIAGEKNLPLAWWHVVCGRALGQLDADGGTITIEAA